MTIGKSEPVQRDTAGRLVKMLVISNDKLYYEADDINANVYTLYEVKVVTVSDQIKVLCVRCGVSEAELARRLGKSPQSLNAKIKRNTMTVVELEEIARVLGVEFKRSFILENGEEV